MWRNAGIKIIISGTLNWSTVGILGILNFFVLFCFVVFSPVQAGLWDHRPIGGTFPKSQTDLCLRRRHAVGGEGPANSWERSEQEQPGDTGGTPVNLSNLWTLMRVWTRGTRGRQSPEDYCTDDQTAMNGLNFVKMLFVIKSNALCSCCLMFFWAF